MEKWKIAEEHINVYTRNVKLPLLIRNRLYVIDEFTTEVVGNSTYVTKAKITSYSDEEDYLGWIPLTEGSYKEGPGEFWFGPATVREGRKNYLNLERNFDKRKMKVVSTENQDTVTDKIKNRFWNLTPEEGLLEAGLKEAVRIINEG